MKGDLANQYQKWHEKIESRIVNLNDVFNARVIIKSFWVKMKHCRGTLKYEKYVADDEYVKQKLTQFIKELDQFIVQLIEQRSNFVNSVNAIIRQPGLTPQRIQHFDKFTADESFVGEQCVICMGDIEVGRNIMRLDCDGHHTFCQVCIKTWFTNKKTCPTCRHEF